MMADPMMADPMMADPMMADPMMADWVGMRVRSCSYLPKLFDSELPACTLKSSRKKYVSEKKKRGPLRPLF